MLGYWRSHSDYQTWLKAKLTALKPIYEAEISYYATLIEKVYVLDIDPVKKVISSLYSSIGRPAQNQPDMFRALVAMLDCNIHDITDFVERLKASPVLSTICGFEGKAPGVGTFYDFLDRLWLLDAPQKVNRKPKSKRRKRPKSGEKLAPKHPDIVKRLVGKVLEGRVIEHRPEKILQIIIKDG